MNLARSRVGTHPVTQTAHRFNCGYTELPSQTGDKYFECVGVAIESLSVNMLRQFIVRDDFSRMVHQVGENSEFMACQLDESPVQSNLHCSNIKRNGAATKLAAALSCSPTDQSPDAGQNLFCPERFRHVIISAAIDSL